MDGFDEISPTHADKAAVILSELMKTKVERVWVTSRPVQKERLEKKLSVIAFGMKRLSLESQVEMLRKMRTFKASDDKYKLNKLLSRLNESVHDENFTGSPLYITMIATVYEMDMETHLNSEDSRWPEIDLVKLYEVFVERKLYIYLTDKQKADMTNSSVRDNFEYLKETLFNKFEKCALVAILPPTVLESLHDKKIEEEIQPFLDWVQAGKDKTGIVMNVVDGKPQFVHRTFTEYFTARWFSRNFKDNRRVMEHILFDRGFRLIADMFNLMLARHSPLHCAVLNRERKRIENLLKEGSDLRAVDSGGRTVMHIIATKGDLYWDGISRYQNYKVSSDKTDSVLQWTPLRYAIKSEDWYIVQRLLEINVDTSGLNMIRQRAQDQQYINPIIIQAAQNGQLLLLEFLRSIGVNIHRASDRGFLSPLHAAVQGEQLQVVRWLIKHRADCYSRYSDGKTPLFHAVFTGSFEVVRALVEEGRASVDIRDVHGNTVIGEARRTLQTQKCFCSEDQVEIPNKIVEYLEMELRKERQQFCNVI
jgi:ankyrin repeat protein